MFNPPDFEPDDISKANSQNYFTTSFVEDKENIEICPTTNAADENFNVRAKTAYGGKNNDFTISVSGLICKTMEILVGKRCGFHRSMSEKYSVQCFCALTKGTSFSLIYPESAMFLSVFWSTKNDNHSTSELIPSPLLSRLCKENSFSGIPTQVCSRLTYFSSSASYDYRYMIFGH